MITAVITFIITSIGAKGYLSLFLPFNMEMLLK